MTVNSTDAAARAELWQSFRSLLQSYLAAATIGSDVPEALLFEGIPGQLQIIGPAHTVRLEFEAATGEGYWAVSGVDGSHDASDLLDEGKFRLHLDAQFEWSGKPGRLEMDQVAEALAMMVLS